MKNKKVIYILIALVLLFSLSVVAEDIIRVYVNGTRISSNGVLIGDRTYIPLRAVSEAMGAEVSWDQNSKSASVEFSEDDAVSQIVANVSPSVVTIIGNYAGSGAGAYSNPTAHGTGVIYKTNGYIITNAHVVKDIKNLTVVLSTGELYPGNVLFSDEDADLAIVKIERIGLTAIDFAKKESILSGKTAIAIGTPISLSMRNTVTKGIVSGVDVGLEGSYYKLIQTDAAINPGNSGGPLVNVKGQLIGINSSKYASANIDNIGFAIPVDTVDYVIKQYETNGKILRPSPKFGLSQSWEATIGLPTNKGLTVKGSTDTVLKNGDTVTAFNGYKVHSIVDWNEAIKASYNGVGANITYIKDGAEITVYIEM
ncbi:MAG: trypsin-like serine protease [Ruminococcaceae bacterium]|nr:trypsin-like serine protease [Oscillospiraceae bacterium]